MVERSFSDGQYFFRAGDAADGVYRVRSGAVRIERRLAAGPPVTVMLRAGEIFGETGFLTGDARDGDAVAVGDGSVDVLRRNEFLALLTGHPDLIAPLFGRVFALADPSAAPSAAPSATPSAPEPAAAVRAVGRIRMVPDGRRVRAIVGADEIAIDRLPFRIGRTPDGEGRTTYVDVDLALDDRRPFNLSRRHFAIEDEGDGLVVRDFGSYHGTTVNGLTIGGQGRPKTAPLRTGESELIAGKPDSPFRFRIIVE